MKYVMCLISRCDKLLISGLVPVVCGRVQCQVMGEAVIEAGRGQIQTLRSVLSIKRFKDYLGCGARTAVAQHVYNFNFLRYILLTGCMKILT